MFGIVAYGLSDTKTYRNNEYSHTNQKQFIFCTKAEIFAEKIEPAFRENYQMTFIRFNPKTGDVLGLLRGN